MGTLFFEKPILNSLYDDPSQHWELDETGQPTQKVIESRRQAEFKDVYAMQKDFGDKVKVQFDAMLNKVKTGAAL
jgi:type III restriction enzyme